MFLRNFSFDLASPKNSSKETLYWGQDLINISAATELELATNPFMRCDAPDVRKAAEARSGVTAGSDRVRTFAAIRNWTDDFR